MSTFPTANSTFPLWVIVLLGGFAGMVIIGHMASLVGAEMPARRRRIRMANGVLLLALTGLLMYALGWVGMLPSGGGSIKEIREFVLVWVAIIGVVPMVLGLAALDVAHTWRLRRDARRIEMRRLRAEMLREVEIHVKARLARTGARVAPETAGGEGRTGGAGDDGERR